MEEYITSEDVYKELNELNKTIERDRGFYHLCSLVLTNKEELSDTLKPKSDFGLRIQFKNKNIPVIYLFRNNDPLRKPYVGEIPEKQADYIFDVLTEIEIAAANVFGD